MGDEANFGGDSPRGDSGSSGGDRIDTARDDDVQAWAKKLDATPQQIRDAVQAVGDRAADVEMHLKGSHATTNADQEERGERRDDNG